MATVPAEEKAARLLAQLLSQAAADRAKVAAAWTDVLRCGASLERDQKTFQSSASLHHTLVQELGRLSDADSLPPGLLSTLDSAWTVSEEADNDLAAWASDQVDDGCAANDTSDPHYRDSDTPDAEATADKRQFVTQWNRIALRYQLRTYTYLEI